MKHSRIATVVRIRRLQERIARGDVVRAQQGVAAADTAETAAVATVDRLAAAAPSVGTAFLANRKLVERGIGDVLVAAGRAEEARDHARRSLDRWHESARRLDGVERLDERLSAIAAVDEQRATIADLDDLTVMRHGRGPGR